MTRLIRKALWGWEAWRRRRQMQRVAVRLYEASGDVHAAEQIIRKVRHG